MQWNSDPKSNRMNETKSKLFVLQKPQQKYTHMYIYIYEYI